MLDDGTTTPLLLPVADDDGVEVIPLLSEVADDRPVETPCGLLDDGVDTPPLPDEDPEGFPVGDTMTLLFVNDGVAVPDEVIGNPDELV